MGYKIKEIRTKKQMTQEELCKKTGVSREIISGLETGRRTVTSTKMLKRIADGLECKVSEIFLD